MDDQGQQDSPEGGRLEAATGLFSCPAAPGQYDRMLAAAHALALDVAASVAAAPIIDTEACAAWMAADFARDRRAAPRVERRGPTRDRRRR